MNRFTNLNTEMIPLGDGENPPAHKINPDYVQQPGNPRRCIICNKMHDYIVENTMTGERMSEIDECYDCFWKDAYTFKPITEQINLTIDDA